MLPGWERLSGYESCLGLIPPRSADDPKSVITDALARAGKGEHLLYQERHKIFVYPFFPSKLSGIRSLGFEPFIVLGDELNDLDMLYAASWPATLITAHEGVKGCIRERNGYCSSFASHAATEDLLRWVLRIRNWEFAWP